MAAPAAKPTNPYAPASWDEHREDQAARQTQRLAKREQLIECLAPSVAAEAEARKPTFEWKVEASFMQQSGEGLQKVHKSGQVVAQNERDAWAFFCDKHKIGRGRRECFTSSVTQLKKRTPHGDAS